MLQEYILEVFHTKMLPKMLISMHTYLW